MILEMILKQGEGDYKIKWRKMVPKLRNAIEEKMARCVVVTVVVFKL